MKFDGNQIRMRVMNCYAECLICLTTPSNISPNIRLFSFLFVHTPQRLEHCAFDHEILDMFEKVLDKILRVGGLTDPTPHPILPKH